MPTDKDFIKKLVFRFVKKRIAGSTMNTAFNAAKEVNSSGMSATITFLNECGENGSSKAHYNLMSYMQLMAQLSRLGINAEIAVRPSQLGCGNSAQAEKNLSELLDAAEKYGKRVWIEYDYSMPLTVYISKYSRYLSEKGNAGIELPIKSADMSAIEKKLPNSSAVKLSSHMPVARQAKASKPIPLHELYLQHIKALSERCKFIYIAESDEKLINKIAANKAYKKALIFELPLGYSKKWQKKLLGSGIQMSIYVPYGKDWVPYAINKLTEGHIRDIAISLLDGKERGSNAKRKQG